MLYQRYFLRMNQSNTTHILSLLLALVLSLAAVHIFFIPIDGGMGSSTFANVSSMRRPNITTPQNRTSFIVQHNATAAPALGMDKIGPRDDGSGGGGSGNSTNSHDANSYAHMINHSHYGLANTASQRDSLVLSNSHSIGARGTVDGVRRKRKHGMPQRHRAPIKTYVLKSINNIDFYEIDAKTALSHHSQYYCFHSIALLHLCVRNKL